MFGTTRGFKLVANRSPLRYPTEGATQFIDWLRDGRYVYLVGGHPCRVQTCLPPGLLFTARIDGTDGGA